MRTVLKRVAAYLIDIIIVSLISTLITSNAFINKDFDKYQDTYDEYEEKYNNYIDSLEKLEDEEIKEDEYDEKLEEINAEYKIVEENYNYKLVKLSIIPTSISILVILLYFVVLQYYLKGQTLGKKIMKLQIKSNNDKKLNIFKLLLRSLIVNEVLINIVSIICLILLNKENYLIYNKIVYVISYVLEVTLIFMIVFDKKHRGLHDYIANTKVIDLKE